jgi:diphosphomevalonate decarboxylase
MIAAAVAHPNIALAKYWGKQDRPGNFPAVPSLSVTVGGLSTRTRVAFRDDLPSDRFVLDGHEMRDEARDEALARVRAMLDRVRARAGLRAFAEVVSWNDFPTASGLASSASGFAALALAATRAAGLALEPAETSDLARQSSASAARSVFGGFVELKTSAGDFLAATPVAPVDWIDLAVLVCVVSESKKAIGSSVGMRATAQRSPFYDAWLAQAPCAMGELKAALLARDFEGLGALAESSALAMHAAAMAAGVVYFSGVTLEALGAVRALRAKGTPAFATVDAGPHMKVLARAEDAALVGTWMRAVPGVLRVIEARPGEGARLEHDTPANHAEASP